MSKLLPSPSLAQKKAASKAPAPQKWPIQNMRVEGLKNYSPQQVIAATGLKIGQLAGKEDFEAARDRLQAAGVFETVGYRFAPAAGTNGYAATFEVLEVEPVYPVRFEALHAPATELQAWLQKRDPFFGAKIPATEALLKRHAAAIEEYLVGKGSPEKVAGRVLADSPEKFAIVFRPAAGASGVYQVKRGDKTVFTIATAAPAIESDLQSIDPALLTGRLAGGRSEPGRRTSGVVHVGR